MISPDSRNAVFQKRLTAQWRHNFKLCKGKYDGTRQIWNPKKAEAKRPKFKLAINYRLQVAEGVKHKHQLKISIEKKNEENQIERKSQWKN